MTDLLDNLQRLVTRRGTKVEVEAEAGGALEEVRFAYATDTSELGVYTNGAWAWFGAGATVAALDDLTDVTITSVAAGHFLRYSGSAWLNTLLAVADYPYHAEVLCDSSGPILQSNGDVITVTGVPN